MISLPGLEPHQVARLIPNRPILVSYRGSHTHGTYVPPEQNNGFDDIDIMAVYIPSGLEPFFGLGRPQKGMDAKEGAYDCAMYDLQHMMHLLAGGNPNILSLLWTDPKHFIHVSSEGQTLLDNRSLFATKEAAQKFMHYARGQRERMLKFKTSPDLYKTGWMGEKRKALTEKYGYDCKNASHAVRLLAMAKEFAVSGRLDVDRSGKDAEELIAIKTGKVTLDDVINKINAALNEAEFALTRCTLPEKTDLARVEHLCVEIHAKAKVADVVLVAHHAKLSVYDQDWRGRV